MSDRDLAQLTRVLGLTTHMQQKMRPDPASPGVVRLDHFSGLFLKRGPAEGRWRLEARTWGRPAPETVRGWQLLATFAAHQLDPAVGLGPPVSGHLRGRDDSDRARARLLSRIHRELGSRR